MARIAQFDEAVRSQPEALALAYTSIATALVGLELPRWNRGETVAFVGMGASTFSAHAAVAALSAAGIRAVNITASDLLGTPAGYQPADHYVIVSESGRSPEPVEAARRLTEGRRIAITNFPGEALGEVADFIIPLGGFTDSPAYTVGYTATLMAYSLLAGGAGLGLAAGTVRDVPYLVRQALGDYEAASVGIAQALGAAHSVDFVGHGFSYATAAEGALLFREGLRVHSAAFETHQYLHGPMEALASGSGLVIFGDGREVSVARQAAEAGVPTVLVTALSESAAGIAEHDNLTVLRLPAGVDTFARAIVETVVVQLIVLSRAAQTGIPVEEFLFHQDDTKLAEAAAE
jgi:glucosamine--fructose-6-phosphate aminotransferase (isomerizing)